nr:MAG TPA: Calcium-activated SK potassium channel [Caudoviricetes sp.]
MCSLCPPPIAGLFSCRKAHPQRCYVLPAGTGCAPRHEKEHYQ